MRIRASQEPFDVIVCGAGHAGVEASLAAARMGARTLLLSGNVDTVAQMSCNPAIGGVGKGHIVREIDALGGEMAINADVTGIQFRLLNASKGTAVQAPRAQCDKKAYQFRMKHTLEAQVGLELFQAFVTGLIIQDGRVSGCRTNLDIEFLGRTIIITTGTFLRGVTHVGSCKSDGGRMGDHAASTLSGSLTKAGIELKRLKTGTPPRISGRSVDFSRLEEQVGDTEPTFFAFHDTRCDLDLFHVERVGQERIGWMPGERQVSCWLTRTTCGSAAIVRENLGLSALYGGGILGAGPRYCPSIEDKFVRFAERDSHVLFLEPEGRNTDEHYVNGLSSSLPFDVQMDLVRSIPGLERAIILRPAYAVEYDFAPPTQLFSSLESRVVEGLFFAGQINGTSGYEEAAGQGIVAGINAVRKIRGWSPLIMERHQSYIGVMIDDLVTKGAPEPYRMFTSRAEHRLLMNHGSAELRLSELVSETCLISPLRMRRIRSKRDRIEDWIACLESKTVENGTWGDLIRRESTIIGPKEFAAEPKPIRDEVIYRIAHKGYLERQQRQVDSLSEIEQIRIPEEIDYMSIPGLKRESAQRLAALRPYSLGQANRISGVNPSDISILMVYIRRFKSKSSQQATA